MSADVQAWWPWLLGAGLACGAIKLAGYSVPASWLHNRRMHHMAASMTVALLTALTVMNTWAAGAVLVVDARMAALVVAAIALALRLPFLVVVVLGAGASAAVRYMLA